MLDRPERIPVPSEESDIAESDAAPIGRAQILMFAVVATALFMSTLDQTIVATALDSMQRGLGTSVTAVGWTITAYSLGMVMMLSLAGKLTQRMGARRVFLASMAIFAGASLACGLVDRVELLVAMRFVQAVGGAGFTPSATRLVVDHFGEARDKAVGLFGALFTTGAMVGPLVGGLIVPHWSWRGVFLVNVPLGAILIVAALRFIPPDAAPASATASPEDREHLDLTGVALAGVGLFAMMLALSVAADRPDGWVAITVVGSVIAVGALALFLRHIARVDEPVIEPELVHGPGFAAVNVINVLFTGAGMGLVALLPWYATDRYGIDTFGSGTVLAAEGVAAIVLSTTGAFLLRRTGYRLPLYVTAVFVVLGATGIALPPPGISAYVWLAISAALIGVGIGFAGPASRNAGLQLVPDQAAPIAALRSSGIQIGSIAAVSAATTTMASVSDEAIGLAWVFIVYGIVTVLVGVFTVPRIPEHHGSW